MKTMLIAAAVAMAAALSAPTYAADQPTIPIIVKDTTSYYWQIVLAGARKAGKDLGVKVPELGAQSESDINGQISILENAVAEKPAAVVIAPTEFKALGKPIDEAAKKVPVIGIDSARRLEGLHVVPDHRQRPGRAHRRGRPCRRDQREIRQGRGRRRADHLAARRRLARPARQRASRKSSRPNIRASSSSPTKSPTARRRPALNIMTDLITANPNLRGVFASNLIMAQGAGQAIAENKKADTIKLVGFDSDDKLIGFLKDGTISALVVQDPYRMGYDGIKTALAASKGEKVEKFVDTGANLITKANMDGEKQHALLFPKVK